jgi:hypothetical protein
MQFDSLLFSTRKEIREKKRAGLKMNLIRLYILKINAGNLTLFVSLHVLYEKMHPY